MTSVDEALERLTGARFSSGNRVSLVNNGAVFDQLIEAVGNARSSVHLLTFIWRGEDGPSDRIGRAVLARRAGVECRILVDAFGSFKFSDALEAQLEASGCEIRRREELFTRPFARNHRRVIVIDGRVGLTGGFGIWKSWEGNGRAEDEWRDVNALIEGPVVADMQRAFEQSWRFAGGGALPASAYPPLGRSGAVRAAFVASAPASGLPSAGEIMTHLGVAAAERRLWIANSYFVPDDPLQRRLVRRAQAGVDVRVLSGGPVHDQPLVRAAQRETYETLLPGGVRIWEYQPSMMHSKVMLVDDRIAVIGSTNIDALSFDFMEEASLIVDSPAVAKELERALRADLRHAREIGREEWERRNLFMELGREMAALLRRFL